jgi:hypothetical protein
MEEQYKKLNSLQEQNQKLIKRNYFLAGVAVGIVISFILFSLILFI